MPETLRRSNLGLLKPGPKVNLERAWRQTADWWAHCCRTH
ncbi:MAG: hypothetical protein ACLUOF_10205 [Ruminococcus sp.]